jgi:hypothetical protein
MTYLSRLSWGLGPLVLAAGCGLISSDVTNFDLSLPDKSFTIDASSWRFDSTLPAMLPQCPSDLCDAVAHACMTRGCSGECNNNTNSCELHLEFSVYQPVKLVMEKPELMSLESEPVINVLIDSVTYEVTSNTLNIATPEMNVFVAPTSVTTDHDAKQIGTIDGIASRAITDGPQTMNFTETGKDDLIDIMRTFKTPFNVIVAATPPGYTITANDPLPLTGKLEVVVHIKAHAGL